MKSRSLLLLSIIFTLCIAIALPSMAHALKVASRSGPITDSAQFFSVSDKELINKAIKKASFQMHILTIHTLDGEDIADYANVVFAAWKLGANDALFIIADEEGEAHLELQIDSTLEKAIYGAVQYGKSNQVSNFVQLRDWKM